MKHIRLGNSGRVALVDDRDFGRLRRVAWGVVPVRGSVDVYAKTGRSTYMHHLVIGKRSGFEIDHIDGNRLNNTRANLRHVTHSPKYHQLQGPQRQHFGRVRGSVAIHEKALAGNDHDFWKEKASRHVQGQGRCGARAP
jgi:hypothetical protein